MRHALRLTLSLIAVGGWGTSAEAQSSSLARLPRRLTPAEIRIVDGSNSFAFDLLKEATRALHPDANVFLSPLSASMALGMALDGANGQTLQGVQSALRLPGIPEADFNQGYRGLISLLRGLDSSTEMRIANSMWARQGLEIKQAFIEAGRTYFDAEVHSLDFGSPDAAKAINQWVSSKTNKRIPKLLDQIGSNEVLFLINAIYFKGKWRLPFDPKHTHDGSFRGADGRNRTAPLMRQQETLRYDETTDYQAVDLLYGNGAFAMTVLLPNPKQTPGELLARLDPAAWKALTERFHEAEVNLTLPRFRLEYARRLNDDLKAMGMDVAFDPGRADFSRIADVRPNLYLSRVNQKTFVEVNEEGTEAAAATDVGVAVTSVPQVYQMEVDRPFLFAIRERLTGTIVFLGVMNVVGS